MTGQWCTRVKLMYGVVRKFFPKFYMKIVWIEKCLWFLRKPNTIKISHSLDPIWLGSTYKLEFDICLVCGLACDIFVTQDDLLFNGPTCSSILTLSNGETQVLETAPATPPAITCLTCLLPGKADLLAFVLVRSSPRCWVPEDLWISFSPARAESLRVIFGYFKWHFHPWQLEFKKNLFFFGSSRRLS